MSDEWVMMERASRMGMEKPTVQAKKMRTSQREARLNCACQMSCERGTLTKHMPAAKAPSRWEPMKPGYCERNEW